jgi:hypothetical protein
VTSGEEEKARSKSRSRRAQVILIATAVVLAASAILFLPIFPWSAANRHKLGRLIARGEMQIARWRGDVPRLVAITGRVNEPGARVEAVDSVSGWAAIADSEGRFLLPDVMWYPGARFDLIVSISPDRHARVRISAPDDLPEGGTVEAGEIDFEKSPPVDFDKTPGINSISYYDYDEANLGYYKDLFDQLTAGKATDHEKIESVNRFVASKLNYEETARTYPTPRDIIERGSRYCGSLALAMATIIEAGGYRARWVDLIDKTTDPTSHVAVEVYYESGWHLYDPTYGVFFTNSGGGVASYSEVRVDTSLIREDSFQSFTRRQARRLIGWMPAVYGSGIHHLYYFKRS